VSDRREHPGVDPATGSADRASGPGDGATGAPGLPRPFACLWCGRTWQPRTVDDLEARARLCPDCLGRAGDNPFLRFRLRAGLDARAATAGRSPPASATTPTHEDELVPYYDARAPEYDDWYLRRGRYAHGPVHDLAWQMELDAATSWLDGLPLRGEIVELAAGTGWWSALLATKGELHAYDAAAAPLDRARDRLLAHRLRAHLHVRDAWAAPDRAVDALFAGFWLSHVPRARLGEFVAVARAWLKPVGRFAAIDSLPDPASGVVDRLPAPAPDLARRRLADGREFTIPKVHYIPDELATALAAAGFGEVDVRSTGRFFLLATAVAR
jgi:demethylmenaquinone methyltransferase/2-methoxy-6-polyprenyl-1,4-benzoquinol methylase